MFSGVLRRHALALAVALPLALVACSDSGGDDSTAAPGPGGGGTCTPRPGNEIVVLVDDKGSQFSDNVVPLVRTDVAEPPLVDALNSVSAALSQDALKRLNQAVSIDKQPPADAAVDFIAANDVADEVTGGSGPIVVGAANFSESEALAHVYAEALRRAGYDATVRKIGARALYEPALEAGEIQVFPEYAASLTQFLAQKDGDESIRPSSDIEETMAVLRPLVEKRGLTVLEPAAATDQNAFAVTRETATEYGLTTLSDLAAECGGSIVLGAPPECAENPACKEALESTYGISIARLEPLDLGPLTRAALKQGRVLVSEVLSSDPDVVLAG